jgi:HEPN domain-containing protein
MERDKPKIDTDKIVNHYRESSEDDFNTMMSLYNSKSYNRSLFIGHITLEKLIKALYVKIN